MTATERPLRRDAERNRQRIIDAAREVFATQGIGAGLNEIAHHAGLAVGTVYRRFPDKDALVQTALRDEFEALVALADEGLAEATGWDGLTTVFRRAVAMNVASRGLRDLAFSSDHGRRHVEALRPGMESRVKALLDRARAEGSLRPDVTVVDFFMMMLMVTEFAYRTAAVQPDAYRRYLELLITSLRGTPSRHAGDLGTPVTAADARAIALQWRRPSATDEG